MNKFYVFFVLVFAFGLSACDFNTPDTPAVTPVVTPPVTPPVTPAVTPPDAIFPPDTPLPLDLTRCEDCKDILTKPYTPRHDGKQEDGVFWEVPIKKVGDSIMPIHDGSNGSYSSEILVVDNYEQLNSLRIMAGYPNISRPVTHNYAPEFFETSALIFVTVYTPSGGYVPFIFFEALVTDSVNFFPVFGLNLPEGNYIWTADIGQRSFLIEVDRAIVDNYNVGSLGMGKGWNANWNKFENSIQWLCDKCESRWEFTQPSDEWGICIGEDDSNLVRRDYNFSVANDRLQWSGGFGGPHEVYIKRHGMDEFEYLFEAWGNGNIDLVRFGFLEGTNIIKIIGNNMEYVNGEYIRAYDYFKIETAAGYVENNYQFTVSILSGQMKMGLTWDSTAVYAVYVQRAGTENFELVSELSSGSRGVLIDSFGLLEGTNVIKLETFKFDGEKAIRNIAKYSLVLEGEKRQEHYSFMLVGGGSYNPVNWSGGYAISWTGGSNQFYDRYIKRAGTSDFVPLGSGPNSWAILLGELDLSDDTHTLRVEGWEFSGGALRRIYSDFNFEVRTHENSNINIFWDNEKLTWSYSASWQLHKVAVKRAGTDYFHTLTTFARGNFGIELSSLKLNKGINIVEIEVAWSFSGNIFTREAGYFSIEL